MGLGERNLEGDIEATDEGIFKLLSSKDAPSNEAFLKPPTPHPANTAVNNKKGNWQKLRSRKIPLLQDLFTYTILIIVIIILGVLLVKGKTLEETSTIPEKSYIHICIDDWIWNRGKCYYFSNTTETWKNSQDFCKSHNSSLADIENEQELDLLNRLKCDSHWIGLSRAQNNSVWVWTNGTTYSESLFGIIRLPVVPGDVEQVYLNGEGVKSGSGKYAKKWICKKDAMNSIQTYKQPKSS